MALKQKFPNQVIGNTGLFYVCYELSKRGWNVLPTSRNAKGPDIIIYNTDATITHTIQVKAISGKVDTVNLGEKDKISNLTADYFIICSNVDENPNCYIMTKDEIISCTIEYKNRKTGKINMWVQPTKRRGVKHGFREFKDNWDKIK